MLAQRRAGRGVTVADGGPQQRPQAEHRDRRGRFVHEQQRDALIEQGRGRRHVVPEQMRQRPDRRRERRHLHRGIRP
jgi:hypothetical protein